eukprot:6175682-Pleurochrysis_carterae.AAC.2
MWLGEWVWIWTTDPPRPRSPLAITRSACGMHATPGSTPDSTGSVGSFRRSLPSIKLERNQGFARNANSFWSKTGLLCPAGTKIDI